jgi:protein-L-isoaspartate(D-aspartate) O-methyltransferase
VNERAALVDNAGWRETRPMKPLLVCLFLLALSCWSRPGISQRPPQPSTDGHRTMRERMVAEQIEARGVKDPRVLAAMREVPRHLFVEDAEREAAYDDRPLPIGHEQTISQPYIVALMTELARPAATDRALEIGTGSGYQTAVLSKLVSEVYTIEIIEPLGNAARQRLEDLGYRNVRARIGDGYGGWPEHAPFDLILVTAAPNHIPPALFEQLKPGGRLVIPVGDLYGVQELQLVRKDETGRMRVEDVAPVRFVPLRRRDA